MKKLYAVAGLTLMISFSWLSTLQGKYCTVTNGSYKPSNVSFAHNSGAHNGAGAKQAQTAFCQMWNK